MWKHATAPSSKPRTQWLEWPAARLSARHTGRALWPRGADSSHSVGSAMLLVLCYVQPAFA